MRPPFFTASLRSARAAVVPQAPQLSRPISSKIAATLSPTAGVGARDRSIIPKGTFRRREASWATSWPTRVILKAVFLIVSATTSKGSPLTLSRARLTTPGPLTPTLTQLSPWVTPWKAPAIKGLSSTGFEKTTSLAQPKASCSFVSSPRVLKIRPISATASMLIPALVEPTATELQTRSVVASASGMEARSLRSPSV